MGWRNKTYGQLSQTQEEEQAYVYVQWMNDGQSLEPRQESGGFFLPHDQPIFEQQGLHPADVAIPGLAATRYFKSGSEVQGVYAPHLDVAVLAHRFRWEQGRGSDKQYAYNCKYPGIGWRGKTQVLALIQGGERQPYLLTFSGWPGTHFLEALAHHETTVANALKKAGERAPHWIFLGRYAGGEQEMVGNGQKSPVTRITYEAAGFDLDQRYVGDEAAEMIKSKTPEIVAWREEWDGEGESSPGTPAKRNSGSNGNGRNTAAPTASQAQWQTIRHWLTMLGYAEDHHGPTIHKAGYDPDNLTVEAADALIERLKQAPAPDRLQARISELLAGLGYVEERQAVAIRKAGYDPTALTLKQASDLVGRLQRAQP